MVWSCTKKVVRGSDNPIIRRREKLKKTIGRTIRRDLIINKPNYRNV